MAPSGAVVAGRYNHSLHSGTSFASCGVDLIHVADLVGFELQSGLEVAFDVKGVLRVGVGGVLVVGVLGGDKTTRIVPAAKNFCNNLFCFLTLFIS